MDDYEFDKTVYISDWTWDVRAAKILGWDFVGIASGEKAEVIRAAGAKRVLLNFKGLVSELDDISKSVI